MLIFLTIFYFNFKFGKKWTSELVCPIVHLTQKFDKLEKSQ